MTVEVVPSEKVILSVLDMSTVPVPMVAPVLIRVILIESSRLASTVFARWAPTW